MIILTTTLLLLAHEFYSKECCSDRDCHPVPCEEISVRGNEYVWHNRHILRERAQVAPDGGCHVCLDLEHFYCIYLGGTS